MKLRNMKTGESCTSGAFNIHSLNEIVVCYRDCCDSDYLDRYEILLQTGPRAGQWVTLPDAFRKNDLIRDNYNTRFFEPPTPEDRERGHTL